MVALKGFCIELTRIQTVFPFRDETSMASDGPWNAGTPAAVSTRAAAAAVGSSVALAAGLPDDAVVGFGVAAGVVGDAVPPPQADATRPVIATTIPSRLKAGAAVIVTRVSS